MVRQVLIKWSDGNYVRDNGEVVGVSGKVLKPVLTKYGYHGVSLKVNGKFHPYRIHRLVAEAFIPNPENKPEVNHINGIKTDNRVENLEWVTSRENQIHATQVLGKCIGETHGMALLTEDDVRVVCELLVEGYQTKKISEVTGVNEATVAKIRHGRCWKHISKEYKFQKKSRCLSVETVEWVCRKFCEGMSSVEILNMATNPNLTLQVIKAIKHRRNYKFISDNFDF